MVGFYFLLNYLFLPSEKFGLINELIYVAIVKIFERKTPLEWKQLFKILENEKESE